MRLSHICTDSQTNAQTHSRTDTSENRILLVPKVFSGGGTVNYMFGMLFVVDEIKTIDFKAAYRICIYMGLQEADNVDLISIPLIL